jgi:hypothetical protein
MNSMFCFKMVLILFTSFQIFPLFLQGHGVSSDTTGHPIVESNSSEHYLGLVNVCFNKILFENLNRKNILVW